jgi:hypothetical protein
MEETRKPYILVNSTKSHDGPVSSLRIIEDPNDKIEIVSGKRFPYFLTLLPTDNLPRIFMSVCPSDSPTYRRWVLSTGEEQIHR